MVNKRSYFREIKLFYLVFIFLISGCATVAMPKIGEEGYSVADDEQRLLKRADELCERLDESGYIYENKRLEEYLTNIGNTLLPDNIKSEGITIKVRVLSEPSLNAFALINGKVYVHTGMLATIDNESQIAALLAHEISHIVGRHTLKQFRSTINKSAFFSTIQAPAALIAGDLGGVLAQLAVVSSMYGYSRELELEVDKDGFKMMQMQGYDTEEALRLFKRLDEFIENEEIKQPFFFSTHPNVAARIANYEILIRENPRQVIRSRDKDKNDYSELVNELVLDNCKLCLQEGMFKTAQNNIDKFISKNPSDARGYYYLGELYRQRQDHGKKEKQRDKTLDYPKAIEVYDQAIRIDPQFCDAFKQKGRILEKEGKVDEAKDCFRQYLKLNPDAQEKEYFERYLRIN